MDNFPATISLTIDDIQLEPKDPGVFIVVRKDSSSNQKKPIKKRGRPRIVINSEIKIIQGPVMVDFS